MFEDSSAHTWIQNDSITHLYTYGILKYNRQYTRDAFILTIQNLEISVYDEILVTTFQIK